MNVAVLFLIIAAITGGYYLYSLWRWPRRPCRWCGGKVPRDPVMKRAFGQCSHCGGSGWKYRLGARMIGKGK